MVDNEVTLDKNAPEALQMAYGLKELGLKELSDNPDWLVWLRGKEQYIKEYFPYFDSDVQKWIRGSRFFNRSPEVNEFVSLMYEDEIRAAIINDEVVAKHTKTSAFRERNPDIFFDDLPLSLQGYLEDRNNNQLNVIFELFPEEKELLKGKRLAALFNSNYTEFFEVFGDNIEAFEVYEKYAGIIESIAIYMNESIFASKDQTLDEVALSILETTKLPYGEEMPEEFKQEYQEYFLDENAPQGLKDIFYNGHRNAIDMFVANPAYVPFLRGKNIQRVCRNKDKEFLNFCDDTELAIEFANKYMFFYNEIKDWSLLEDEKDLSKEEQLRRIFYRNIEMQNIYNYSVLFDVFYEEYPELFLTDDEARMVVDDGQKTVEQINRERVELKREFYGRDIRFFDMRHNIRLADLMREKNLRAVLEDRYGYLIEICNGDNNKVIDLGLEYGDILGNSKLVDLYKRKKESFENISPEEVIDNLIYEGIIQEDVVYDERTLPKSFQERHPDLFLLSEELDDIEVLNGDHRYKLKSNFYLGKVTLEELSNMPQEVIKIFKTKNLRACMNYGGRVEEFINKFTDLLKGDRDVAFNLCMKYSSQIDVLLGGLEGYQNIDKILKFYKEAGFIPHQAVVRKLPEEKIKDFAFNSKLWGNLVQLVNNKEEKLNRSQYDILSSLVEAASVMGVFETKKFVKKGEVRYQGIGKEGFEKLKSILNYTPEYLYSSVYDNEEEITEKVGEGYVKTVRDYLDEVVYQEIAMVARENDLYDEFVQEELSEYDVEVLKENLSVSVLIKANQGDVFEYNPETGTYRCAFDRNMNSKIKAMFEALGIKQKEVLSEEEYALIQDCDREYILQAFEEMNVSYDGRVYEYKFNMSQQGDKFVIGDNVDIGIEESKRNKKLFDYVRFLMMEYGLDEEGVRLAANNDRSNIDLVIDSARMENILKAADKISETVQVRYDNYCLWRIKEGKEDSYNWFNLGLLHQLFDGMEMKYNKAFREFFIENIEDIVEDEELSSRINSIQRKIIEISKDPAYAEQKITPELVLRALSNIEYSDKRVGFENGEELAAKFSFTQEEFEEAQTIWEAARKREASAIPRIEGKDNEYSYEVLRLDDATGIFMGNMTDCCQKIGGVGESAMYHSMTEKSGRVFVIRNNVGKVVAQAWLWRNGNTICFDNVEIPNSANSYNNQEAVYEILKKAAKDLCDKDDEVFESLVKDGKLDEERADRLKAKRVTVGKGNTDVRQIRDNYDLTIEDREGKHPLTSKDYYLYTSDSEEQVILYEAEDYRRQKDVPTLAIHRDSNIEKSCNEIEGYEIKMMEAIECEYDEQASVVYEDIKSTSDLAKMYGVTEEELCFVRGTDWFMLYSETENEITVHRMLKSPSSGILKKSVREQKEAVKMIMDRAIEQHKSVSIETEYDRVYDATKMMIKHIKRAYEMTVAEEESRIRVSDIQTR